MNWTTFRIAMLLFGSGACALVYQTAWLREFRLIFGASTSATAAVLAVFMGGLGVGSLLLGRRADEHPRPLALYAYLEAGIAASAAVSPFLLWAARSAYVAVGGTSAVGATAGTVVRLAIAAVVLAVPTVLMGGTLPAAARAAEGESDVSRRRLALLYGLNTLGAVAGAVVSTFLLLESFGNRRTLWIACGVNVAIAAAALLTARTLAEPVAGTETEELPDEAAEPRAPAAFVLVAAAVVGFAFFLMEIVWYRMLGPVLGGSTFTFGLILAVALFGVGAGGAAYALFAPRRPCSVALFAASCAVEALCLAYPYALGDSIAVVAALLRPLGRLGLGGYAASWAIVTAIVALPAAFVAGAQFPMLVSLLGRGRESVGRHVAAAYATNTLGAIAGSLAAGFGVLPLVGAAGAWRIAVGALVGLCLVAAVVSIVTTGRPLRIVPGLVAATVAVVMVVGTGPTAAWRHSPIGVGRVGIEALDPNEIQRFVLDKRRAISWSVDGIESSVALDASTGYAFIVNGKSDGHSRYDAPTQVMSGLLGALVHPQPRSAFVIGLGTGSTAGWLGAIDEIERVDVVEFEPAIVHVANACGPVNASVLANPKVNVTFGDAREVVTTSDRRYDVVFSEPSNPYRAGVASLFTHDFYVAARERVAEGGVFVQWFQTYEVDGATIETAAATLATVFPEVQLWQTQPADLMLIASDRPIVLDVGALRKRIESEPYRSALAHVWGVSDLEGVLARFVADGSVARALADEVDVARNTDDRNFLEFGFARTLGMRGTYLSGSAHKVQWVPG
jgi:spermidine synthase